MVDSVKSALIATLRHKLSSGYASRQAASPSELSDDDLNIEIEYLSSVPPVSDTAVTRLSDLCRERSRRAAAEEAATGK